MLVSAAVGGNENSQLYLISPYGSPWTRITSDDGARHNFGAWTRDGGFIAYASNERNKKDFDIFEYQLDSVKTSVIYQGEGSNIPAAYSQDGRYLIIIHSTSSTNSDFLLYDRESKATNLLSKHEGDAVFADPVWALDNKSFYFLQTKEENSSVSRNGILIVQSIRGWRLRSGMSSKWRLQRTEIIWHGR